MMAWVDLETTGLDPKHDRILEVALVITDNDLNELTFYHDVLYPAMPIRQMAENVRKMHESSGLLADCLNAGIMLDTAIKHMKWMVTETCKEPPPLAGSTIGFDKAFLAEFAPDFLALCHYRSVDVSTLKVLNEQWKICPSPPKGEAHRALADIRESITNLKYYRDNMLRAS